MAQFGFVKQIQDQRHICQWKDVKLIKKKKGWNHSGCAQKWVGKPDLGRLGLTAVATKTKAETNKCKDKNKNLGAHLPWEPS